MKATAKIVAAGVLAVGATAAVVGWIDASLQTEQPAAKPTAQTQLPKAGNVLGVDEVAKDPKAHQGRIVVEGVVDKVMVSRRTFTLIDSEEFAACGVTTCAEYSLPVSVPETGYRGALPKEQETLVLLGELTALDRGFRFDVLEVKRGDAVIISRID